MHKTLGPIVAGGLGIAAWLVPTLLGPGPTAAQAGVLYLVSLGVAGFLVALLDRELSWTSLASLYGGQIVVLGVWAALGNPTGDEPILLQPLFVLSFSMAAVLGGVLGAALQKGAWSSA